MAGRNERWEQALWRTLTTTGDVMGGNIVPVGGGSGRKLDTSRPDGYLDPPPGMTQAQALEELALQSMAGGLITGVQPGVAGPVAYSLGGTPPTTAHHRQQQTANPTTAQGVRGALNRVFGGIPEEKRFHEPAAKPQAEVITAYKLGRLWFTQKGPRLTGPVQTEAGAYYDLDGIAECRKNWGGGHPPGAPVPAKSCTCGFYAIYEREDLDRSYYQGSCILQVEMFGRVVKGSIGCRAARQRIIAVYIDSPGCVGVWCDGQPMGFGIPPGATRMGQRSDADWYELLCRHHFDTYDPMRRFSLADLRNKLGCEVGWNPIDPDANTRGDD